MAKNATTATVLALLSAPTLKTQHHEKKENKYLAAGVR